MLILTDIPCLWPLLNSIHNQMLSRGLDISLETLKALAEATDHQPIDGVALMTKANGNRATIAVMRGLVNTHKDVFIYLSTLSLLDQPLFRSALIKPTEVMRVYTSSAIPLDKLMAVARGESPKSIIADYLTVLPSDTLKGQVGVALVGYPDLQQTVNQIIAGYDKSLWTDHNPIEWPDFPLSTPLIVQYIGVLPNFINPNSVTTIKQALVVWSGSEFRRINSESSMKTVTPDNVVRWRALADHQTPSYDY